MYGGPGVQRVVDDWPPLTLQLFTRAGYVVFELDNRGSGNREPKFEAPIYLHLGGAEVEDQLLGLAHLESQPWIDPSRIAVFGHSYGGFMTLMCLAAAGTRLRAGVSVAPVTDWRLYDTHYTERYLGDRRTIPRPTSAPRCSPRSCDQPTAAPDPRPRRRQRRRRPHAAALVVAARQRPAAPGP
ncbi:MAG: alpha/beta fold hydrolase, partial [Gammaproteobacteria bacterium]|nr:alpha/beta fold hydrolase [Gammaproteobacteria bacterium]